MLENLRPLFERERFGHYLIFRCSRFIACTNKANTHFIRCVLLSLWYWIFILSLYLIGKYRLIFSTVGTHFQRISQIRMSKFRREIVYDWTKKQFWSVESVIWYQCPDSIVKRYENKILYSTVKQMVWVIQGKGKIDLKRATMYRVHK